MAMSRANMNRQVTEPPMRRDGSMLEIEISSPAERYKMGGKTKKYAKGGRIDGCAMRGKTKGTMR